MIRTDDGVLYWRKYASLGLNLLNGISINLYKM